MCNYALWFLILQGKTKPNVTVITSIKSKSVWNKYFLKLRSHDVVFIQAIEGFGTLRLGKWQQMMVPIKEMTDVMKVVKEVVSVKPKQWVRLKRGIYKDDLAQVHGSLLEWFTIHYENRTWQVKLGCAPVASHSEYVRIYRLDQ